MLGHETIEVALAAELSGTDRHHTAQAVEGDIGIDRRIKKDKDTNLLVAFEEKHPYRNQRYGTGGTQRQEDLHGEAGSKEHEDKDAQISQTHTKVARNDVDDTDQHHGMGGQLT